VRVSPTTCWGSVTSGTCKCILAALFLLAIRN